MKSLFLKQFCALVTGDTAQVQAIKVRRAVIAQLKAQIAMLEGKSVSMETAVEDAQEKEKEALVNFGSAQVTDSYVENLFKAHNRVIELQNELADHSAKMEFLIAKLEEVQKDSDDSAEAEA